MGPVGPEDISMTDELKQRMARLREIAPRLNSATDQASRLVTMVEKLLVEELHIGISAESASFNDWPAGKDDASNLRMVRQTLAFGRVGTGYRIHVVDETGIVDADGRWRRTLSKQTTPWPACGRETKLRAIEKLPDLLDQIITATERLAQSASESASKIGEMIGETKVAAKEPELAPQFMGCPGCGEKGRLINVGSSHWAICPDCELKWHLGTNLLPAWQNETEDDWARNAKLLATYSDAE
jgi:hypothetical protein